MTISPLPAERRSDWEIDNSITLFTLTLVTNWFEKETPLIISPLHETDSIPERIMLYRPGGPLRCLLIQICPPAGYLTTFFPRWLTQFEQWKRITLPPEALHQLAFDYSNQSCRRL
ncbi:type VI secretion protein [Salmonella bongori]|nr:type VI secretion protein [Salmonella bongori]